MVKRKLHHKIIHHGIHQGIPFGGGFGFGAYWIFDSVKEAILGLSGDTKTIQECLDIMQSVLP